MKNYLTASSFLIFIISMSFAQTPKYYLKEGDLD